MQPCLSTHASAAATDGGLFAHALESAELKT
jgi:hypothetical protein